MEKARRPWSKPELIVLVRNKPEEAVLSTCKLGGSPDGPSSTQFTCYYRVDDFNCSACAIPTSS